MEKSRRGRYSHGMTENERPNVEYREWAEVVTDWITEQPVEVRFRTDGEQVWVWASASGDGLDDPEDFQWIALGPRPTS